MPTQQPSPEGGEHHNQVEHEPEQPTPRIYAASLSDYNNGRLHGRWIDATAEPGEIQAAIGAMLAESDQPDAEEWAIHDHEGFGQVHLSEYEPLERVAAIAAGIAEHGPAYAAWAARVGTDHLDDSDFQDAYLGEWTSVEAYAEDIVADLGYHQILEAMPPSMQPYLLLDTAALGRDLEYSGDIFTADTPNGGVWIFDAHA